MITMGLTATWKWMGRVVSCGVLAACVSPQTRTSGWIDTDAIARKRRASTCWTQGDETHIVFLNRDDSVRWAATSSQDLLLLKWAAALS